jgi:prephenate dehydrogenase
MNNSDHVLEALDSYREHLTALRDAITHKDVVALAGLIDRANDIRRILG